ncbi:hypothetical protein BCV70DRAFT_199506 [Testicularia cyperi]|uniref:Mis12-domain-containing protein n=1 Tax=Testicularia cyperi TaxID=1882483 RepID=A0A317XTA0_9BASI|nr:hypothetical protein BCV70DRAFT_199506 [Testicularia cyperi]
MPASRRSSQAASSAAAAEAATKPAPDAAPSATASSSTAAPVTTSSKGKDKAMNPPQGQKDEASTDAHLELLTEHFGFNPKAFIDALVYLSNEHLYKIAEQFEIVVMQQLEHLDGGDLEAEQGVHAILTLMENALDHTLDTFELYCLRSVFGIKTRQARYMTLNHHRGLDLRPSNSSSSKTTSSKSVSRKSLSTAATSTTLSANERSYQLGESEDTLKRKIAAARATQHNLLLAQNAAQKSLDHALQLAQRFSAILSSTVSDADGAAKIHETALQRQPMLTATLGQHARKLKADTGALLKSLGELRSTDPLGDPLFAPTQDPSSNPTTGAAKNGEGDGTERDEFETGEEPAVRAWERGREPYLNWEADRIIAKSKRAATAAKQQDPTALPAQADSTDANPDDDTTSAKTPKRKRNPAAAPTSSKRRTPATASKSR